MALARTFVVWVVTAATVSLAPAASAATTVDWRRDLGRELHAVAVDGEGNAYVTGYVVTGTRRLRTLVVAKYGPGGSKRWTETWRPVAGSETFGNDVEIDPGGRVYVTGQVLSTNESGGAGWFVRAYGPGGELRWHRDAEGWREGPRTSVGTAVDAARGLVVISVSKFGDGGFRDGSLRAFRTDGSLRWTDPFEVPGLATYDLATGVVIGGRGSVFAVGQMDQKRATVDRPVVDQEILVQRLDGGGNLTWILVMRDRGVRDADTAISVAKRGNVLAVAGRVDGGPVTGSQAQRGNAWLGRIALGGGLRWQLAWGEANRRAAEPADVSIGPGGRIHVVGIVRGAGDGVDAFLRSFGPDGKRRAGLRSSSGRFLHGTGVATSDSGGSLWLTVWRGDHDTDRPAGGSLWRLRP